MVVDCCLGCCCVCNDTIWDVGCFLVVSMCLCWVVLLVVCAMIVLGELLFGGSSVCLLALGGFSLCACVCVCVGWCRMVLVS